MEIQKENIQAVKPLIGVPVYGDHECLEAMITSLLQSTNWFDRIIIIESDGDLDYWNKWEKLKDSIWRIEVIHTQKEGPLKAYNKLFEIAKKENKDLFITQTDVIFPRLYKRDWLKIMWDIAQLPKSGLIIPINGGGVSGSDYLNGFNWVGGWATFISRKCWEIFGGYDENYIKGWGVDIDMTYQIAQKYEIMKMNYWVDHHMMNERKHETNPESQKEMKQAGDYFKQKWGIK